MKYSNAEKILNELVNLNLIVYIPSLVLVVVVTIGEPMSCPSRFIDLRNEHINHTKTITLAEPYDGQLAALPSLPV